MSTQDQLKALNKTLRPVATPPARVKFAHITTPQTRFQPEGVYRADLVLDPNDERHAAFLSLLETQADKVREILGPRKGADMRVPWEDEFTKDDEPTGMVIVKASTKAVTKDGDPRPLPVVDSKKQPVKATVGGGSVIICNVKPHAYETGSNRGIKLYLNAVQVRELATYSEDVFQEYDDGFTADGTDAGGGADDDFGDADY